MNGVIILSYLSQKRLVNSTRTPNFKSYFRLPTTKKCELLHYVTYNARFLWLFLLLKAYIQMLICLYFKMQASNSKLDIN